MGRITPSLHLLAIFVIWLELAIPLLFRPLVVDEPHRLLWVQVAGQDVPILTHLQPSEEAAQHILIGLLVVQIPQRIGVGAAPWAIGDLAHDELPRGVYKNELLEPRIVLDVTQVILQHVLEGVAAIRVWPIIKHSWIGRWRRVVITIFVGIKVVAKPAPFRFANLVFFRNAHDLIDSLVSVFKGRSFQQRRIMLLGCPWRNSALNSDGNSLCAAK